MTRNHEPGMSPVVKTVTEFLKGFIFLFGIYVVLYGHLTPGGGFAGGVVIACAFVLLTLAEGQDAAMRTLPKSVASEMDSVGALIFLGMALAGLLACNGGVFFRNFIETTEPVQFKLLSGGIILVCNIGIGLKVGASLFLVFAMLSALHVSISNGERRMKRRGGE